MVPDIETARLRLYAPRLADLEARLAMNRDPEVMRHIRPIPEDVEAQRAEIRARILGRDGPEWRFWHLERLDRPGFLGWCGVFPLEDSGLIEIGYRYRRAAWGQGFATEAARAVLDHGFRVLEIDPMVAVTHPDNRASQAVLRKIGLRAAGTAFHYGQDLSLFRLSRADYLSGLSGRQSPSTSFME